MYKYGKRSMGRLKTCHPDLVKIFNVAIKYEDISILCGVRTIDEQTVLVAQGKSKTMNSKHLPKADGYSYAVDAVNYPVNWKDKGRFYMFVGRIKQIADDLYEKGEITHKLRCGADWDMDSYTEDQTFHDLPHFEMS